MSNSSLHARIPQASNPPITLAHLLLLILVSLSVVVWGATLILGTEGTRFEQYLLLLGFLGLTSALFIFSRIRGNHIGIFYFPVFLTILIFMRFGLAPITCFLNPNELDRNFDGHYQFLIRALFYIVVGMIAFWIGCNLAESRKSRLVDPRPAARSNAKSERSGLGWAVAIYAVVFCTNLYLLHAHLFSYTGSWKAYHSHLSSLQVLGEVSSLGAPAALILVTIEKYFHPFNVPCRVLFWGIFISECCWGLASGMKRETLQPFIIVAVVSSLVEKKFKKGWVVAALMVLIAIYPFSINYRSLVLHQGGVASTADVASTGVKALSATQLDQGGLSSWVGEGWQMTVRRMDTLTSFALVLTLGSRAGLLRGKVHWWMIPYYPFVPRFIWHSKPILNIGQKFSIAIGSTATSSMAITYPGDLYLDGGLPGILLGMFLLGIVAQRFTNSITGTLDKRNLFVYTAVFPIIYRMEIDFFSYWTSLIKSLVILSVIAYIVYGPRVRDKEVSNSGKDKVTNC